MLLVRPPFLGGTACARTASGHATAAPPSADMNSRRPILIAIYPPPAFEEYHASNWRSLSTWQKGSSLMPCRVSCLAKPTSRERDHALGAARYAAPPPLFNLTH